MWRDWGQRFLWLSAGSLIGRLLPYGTLIWLGRHLDASGFATVGAAFAWTAVSTSLTTGGLATVTSQRLAALQEPAAKHRLLRRVAGVAVTLSTALLAVVASIGADAAASLFGSVIDVRAVAPALVGGCAWSLVTLSAAACNGLHAARHSASILGMGGALQGAGLLAGLWLGAGEVPAIVWGFAAGNAAALAFALLRLFSLTGSSAGTAADTTNAAVLWRDVAWATVGAASVTPVTFLAGAIVARGPSAAAQLAAFHALEQLNQLAIYLPNIMAMAMLPLLARRFAADQGVAVRTAAKSGAVLAAACLAMAAALAWDPLWLHRLVGNPSLRDASATRAMLLNASLAPALGLLGSALMASGRFGLANGLNIAWAACFLGLAWAFRDNGVAAVQIARLAASTILLATLFGLLWAVGRDAADSPQPHHGHGTTRL